MAISTSSTTKITSQGGGNGNATALGALMTLFFMMGFITCFNDILIPNLRVLFALNYTQTNLINFCFFGAYFVMSIPAGKLVQKYGYKAIMITGFLVAAVGCALFYPAASQRVYGLFLGALFILASGITMLQVAGNPYVAVLGNPETSSARLTFTQALNSLGTTIAGPLGSWLILSNLPKLPAAINEAKDLSNLPSDLKTILDSILATMDVGYLQNTYLTIAGVLVLLGGLLMAMKLPAIGHGEREIETAGVEVKDSIWDYKHLVLGMVGIFAYVGAEVAIGSHIVDYLGLKNVMGMERGTAGNYIMFYWGGAMAGRFLGTLILAFFNPGKILGYFALGAISLIGLSIITSGTVSMWTLLLVGFCNSLMFPTIFTLSIKGLGKYTDQASGLLCTAIVGGALVPMAFGFMTDSINMKAALILPIICYAYISFFGFKGHKAE